MGFGEFMVVVIVAILAIHPKKWTGLWRMAGQYWARFTKQVSDVKASVHSVLDEADVEVVSDSPSSSQESSCARSSSTVES